MERPPRPLYSFLDGPFRCGKRPRCSWAGARLATCGRVVGQRGGGAHGGVPEIWRLWEASRRPCFRRAQSGGLDVLEVQRAFRQIAAARGAAAKALCCAICSRGQRRSKPNTSSKSLPGIFELGLRRAWSRKRLRKHMVARGRCAAREHAAGRYRGDRKASPPKGGWAKPKCGCFIRLDSCWRALSNRRRRA